MIPNLEFEAIKARAERRDWSKNAFNCAKCPGEDCPAWWKTGWSRTTQDGVEVVPVEGCGFVINQLYAQGALAGAAVNRAAISDSRNQLVQITKQAAVAVAQRIADASEGARQLQERREKLLSGTIDITPEK